MTNEDIDQVLERVRTWTKQRQENAVQTLLAMEELDEGVYHLTPEEEADLEEALREVERGEIASDEEVAAVFNHYRR
jgi:predicted transcriptional regulator